MTNRIKTYAAKIKRLYGYEKAFYFFCYATLHRRAFEAWFDFIETGAAAALPDVIKTRLAMRAAFRFVRPWMPLAARIEALNRHHALFAARFSAAGVQSLQTKEGVEIARLTGKSGREYSLYMVSDISKDGAMRISLCDHESGRRKRMASITGVIGAGSDGVPVFWIGALQGAQADGKQTVVAMTKDLNGLRPKQAVLQAVAAVSLWFGAKEMLGPSLKNQIAIKKGWRAENIHTEYDDFWQEFTGGATNDRGDYVLSLPLPRRKLEDVQQKRRKDWKLRYEKVDAMAADIAAALDKI